MSGNNEPVTGQTKNPQKSRGQDKGKTQPTEKQNDTGKEDEQTAPQFPKGTEKDPAIKAWVETMNLSSYRKVRSIMNGVPAKE